MSREKARRKSLTERPALAPENLAAKLKAQTNKSTTDFIMRTKHTANETMNSHIRSKSVMPVIPSQQRVKTNTLMTPARSCVPVDMLWVFIEVVRDAA